jgi:ferric enterobactin receptor
MKYTSHFPLGIVIPLLACSVPLQAAEYDRTIDV